MTDFLLNENGDLDISDSTIALGRSDEQHQQLLLITQKCSWKELPARAVGLVNFINDNNIDGMVAMVRSEFVKDGMKLTAISYTEQTGDLNYDAKYNS